MKKWKEIKIKKTEDVGYDEMIRKCEEFYTDICHLVCQFHVINHGTIDFRILRTWDPRTTIHIKNRIKHHFGKLKLYDWDKKKLHDIQLIALQKNTEIMFEMVGCDETTQQYLLKSIIHYMVNQYGFNNYKEYKLYGELHDEWLSHVVTKRVEHNLKKVKK